MQPNQETPAKQAEVPKNEAPAANSSSAPGKEAKPSQQQPDTQQRLGTITTEPSARMPSKSDEKAAMEEKPSTPAKPSFAALVRKNSTKKAAKPSRASLSHTPKAVEVERSPTSSGCAPTPAGGEPNRRPTNNE